MMPPHCVFYFLTLLPGSVKHLECVYFPGTLAHNCSHPTPDFDGDLTSVYYYYYNYYYYSVCFSPQFYYFVAIIVTY